MIDLGLNQYKIKEIKYEVKEGKTVIFKLNNFNLEDVEIVEKERVCCDKSCTCHTSKTVYDGNVEDKTYATDKQIIDEHVEAENKKIKPRFDALALDKSKELINKIKDVPYKVMEKVGTLYTFDDGTAQYETEEDPYVTNDERETKKQKKEWKEDVIAKPTYLKEKDEAGIKSIINAFKEGDKEENKE